MTSFRSVFPCLLAAFGVACGSAPETGAPPPAAPQPPAPTAAIGGMVSGGEYGCGSGAPLFALVLRDSSGVGEYASVAIDTLRVRLASAGEGRFTSAAGDTLRFHGDSVTFVRGGTTLRCAKTAG